MNNVIKCFGWSAAGVVLLFFTLLGMRVTLYSLNDQGLSTVDVQLFASAILSVGCVALHLRQLREDVRRSIKSLYFGMVPGFAAPVIAYLYNVDEAVAHDSASFFTYVSLAALFFNFILLSLAKECVKAERALPMSKQSG
jgi:predicted permease